MRVREWGNETERATLLWPGLGFTGAYFDPLAERLPRAVAIDPPGHGLSASLDWEDYALPRLALVVDDLARQIGAAAFVGHAWGASVGSAVGSVHPDWLRGLVLVDGGFIPGNDLAAFGLPEAGDRQRLREYAASATSELSSWEEAFAELRAAYGGAWPAHADAVAREVFVVVDGTVCEHGSVEAAAAVFDALRAHDPLACAERIRDARTPTMLIVSTRTPYLAAKRQAWERFVAAAGPSVELHVDGNVGHHPLMEAGDEYVTLIGE